LSTTAYELGHDLREVHGSEIINVLHWIIQQNCLPPAPCQREVDGEQEREARCAPLPAGENELRV
jgi:hypothetical protein